MAVYNGVQNVWKFDMKILPPSQNALHKNMITSFGSVSHDLFEVPSYPPNL